MSFVSIDLWTIIMQWGNLFILLFLVKKFLFKPVMSILEEREKEIGDIYEEAENARTNAETLKQEYTEKLNKARDEAEEIVKNAVMNAKLSSDEIVTEAQERATSMIERANEKILLERKATVNEVKNNISDIALSIAEKVIVRDIKREDHDEMIDKFIEELGDAS